MALNMPTEQKQTKPTMQTWTHGELSAGVSEAHQRIKDERGRGGLTELGLTELGLGQGKEKDMARRDKTRRVTHIGHYRP
jgi:hypothetical protein